MPNVTLITPTRNRPISFELLEGWVRRQTVQPNQWIVVNDGKLPYRYTMGQDVIHRSPRSGEGHSLPENLLAAIPHTHGDFIFVIEDDDWYHPTYIEEHVKALEGGQDIVGCKPSRHYNLLTRRFRVFQFEGHCNLGSTAVSKHGLRELHKVCRDRADFRVDVNLWPRVARKVIRENPTEKVAHVGLKGMPGEPGLGMGHRVNYGTRDMSDMPVLRQWIGQADWDVYRRVAHGNFLA